MTLLRAYLPAATQLSRLCNTHSKASVEHVKCSMSQVIYQKHNGSRHRKGKAQDKTGREFHANHLKTRPNARREAIGTGARSPA